MKLTYLEKEILLDALTTARIEAYINVDGNKEAYGEAIDKLKSIVDKLERDLKC